MSLVLKTLQEKIEVIQEERDGIYQERLSEIEKVMQHYFGNYVDTVKTHLSNTVFYNKVEDSETQNAIQVCTLYHDFEYRRARNFEPEIYISHYSSNVKSDVELSAMISKGEIAEQVLLNREDIIERVLKVYNDFSDVIKEVNKKYYEVDKAIRDEEKRIVEDEKNQIKKELLKGFRMKWVTKNANVHRVMPMLPIGYNNDISVTGIKKVGETASGKTIMLEVLRPNRGYNQETKEWFDKDVKYDFRVKKDYLDSFIDDLYYQMKPSRKEDYRIKLTNI